VKALAEALARLAAGWWRAQQAREPNRAQPAQWRAA